MNDDMMQFMWDQMKSDNKDKAEQSAFSMINHQLLMLLVAKTDLLAGLTPARREGLERALAAATGLTDLMHNPASLEAYAELVRSRIQTLNDEQ